jgi:hypothetical protein
VALRPGSMIVNSSRGGGSKDTWVLEDDTVPDGDVAPPPTYKPLVMPGLSEPGGGWSEQQQQQQQQRRAD